jgi:hypothetical protein
MNSLSPLVVNAKKKKKKKEEKKKKSHPALFKKSKSH